MSGQFSLASQGITVETVLRNPSPPLLYEMALSREPGTAITATGAMVALSGAKTGRSPQDKRIVEHPGSAKDIWWGDVNIKLDEHTFHINRERAVDYLNTRPHLYCVDGFAGWDPTYRIKVRVVCARAYHALFMWNMLIRPTEEELESFGTPDYTIFNAGRFPANRYTTGMTSTTSIDISFEEKEFGWIEVLDRNGEPQQYPFVGISIGVASSSVRSFTHYAEAVSAATEMKQYAKGRVGSTYALDRRTS